MVKGQLIMSGSPDTRRIVGISGPRLWSQRALSVSGTDICTSTKFNLAGVFFALAKQSGHSPPVSEALRLIGGACAQIGAQSAAVNRNVTRTSAGF